MNNLNLYDPSDKTTWITDIDSIQKNKIKIFFDTKVKDNTVSKNDFMSILNYVNSSIIRCIICLCQYPESSKVLYWKETIVDLTSKFSCLNVYPSKKNSLRLREHYVRSGFLDFVSNYKKYLLNEIKTVERDIDFYTKLGEMDNMPTQVMSSLECQEKYGDDILKTMGIIGSIIAKQNIKEIETLTLNF